MERVLTCSWIFNNEGMRAYALNIFRAPPHLFEDDEQPPLVAGMFAVPCKVIAFLVQLKSSRCSPRQNVTRVTSVCSKLHPRRRVDAPATQKLGERIEAPTGLALSTESQKLTDRGSDGAHAVFHERRGSAAT